MLFVLLAWFRDRTRPRRYSHAVEAFLLRSATPASCAAPRRMADGLGRSTSGYLRVLPHYSGSRCIVYPELVGHFYGVRNIKYFDVGSDCVAAAPIASAEYGAFRRKGSADFAICG
jgi:hypothetical protein